MSGFLDDMARSSALRVAQSLRIAPLGAVVCRAHTTPPPPRLCLSPLGFDVIAELKLKSPAAGQLRSPAEDWLSRVTAYARGGAAAVSILTEPSRFDGSLEHLRQAAAALTPLAVPAMRKDFLVDPYQVLEARAAGAGGVLVIVRMLSRGQILELLDAAAAQGMFVLLEAFDAADIEMAGELLSSRPAPAPTPALPIAARAPPPPQVASGHPAAQVAAGQPPPAPILLGINSRDLQTLKVVPQRFEVLAPLLPDEWPAVAESGVANAADAQRMQRLGYSLALIGTALMSSEDPASLLREILSGARTVQR
jgi:indole-3-glycerol phosphate synthase